MPRETITINYVHHSQSFLRVQLMGDLLPRVLEGGRVVCSVLCYTFSGGNITLGPGLSRAQITSPISPPSPDSQSHPRPKLLTRPGHWSPGLPASCSRLSRGFHFTPHSASWEGAGVRATDHRYRGQFVTINIDILCAEPAVPTKRMIIKQCWLKHSFLCPLGIIIGWNLFPQIPSRSCCLSWMLMYSSSLAGPQGDVISI